MWAIFRGGCRAAATSKMERFVILSSINTLKNSKSPYNTLKLDQVLNSCVEFILRFFTQEIFRNSDFFQNDAANSRNRYFIYYICWFYQNYIIFEGFVTFWVIAYSFLANFAVKPGFLHIFKEKLLLWISLSNHSCFYGNWCKFYICPWCRKFNVLPKYIHFYTFISYMW